MPRLTVRPPVGPPTSYRFDKDVITVGRSPTNDLVLGDPAVSPLECEIRRDGERWLLLDRNGHKEPIPKGEAVIEPRPLRAGDAIHIGSLTLAFEPQEGADERSLPSKPSSRRVPGSGGRAHDEFAMVGRSRPFRRLLDRIERVARSMASVLITGESGTGKELVARRLHRRSPRAAGPFRVVNCPAIPAALFESELFGIEKGVATGVERRSGYFEAAQGGVLFLDEIGDLQRSAQAKLLRVLETKRLERVGGRRAIPLDVRIVAATNHDLGADIAQGSFRRDLYHRLNTVTIEIPPLRQRRGDIPLLVEHFLNQAGGPVVSISSDALMLLERYDFPGNVRELERLLEGARILCEGPRIEVRDLPPQVRRSQADAPEPAGDEDQAEWLYRQIVEHGKSFWDVVQRPWIDRFLPRSAVEKLIERGHREAGGSYKGLARLFNIERDYRKLVNFLNHHRLNGGVPKRRARSKPSPAAASREAPCGACVRAGGS